MKLKPGDRKLVIQSVGISDAEKKKQKTNRKGRGEGTKTAKEKKQRTYKKSFRGARNLTFQR